MTSMPRLPWWQHHRFNERGRTAFIILAALATALSGLADANVRRIENRQLEQAYLHKVQKAHGRQALDLVRTVGTRQPHQRPRPALHLVGGGSGE